MPDVGASSSTSQDDKDIPSNLFDAVKEKRWDEARKILEDPSNNEQVDYIGTGVLGHRGTNALHFGAFHADIPEELLHAIIAASPKAAMVRQKWGGVPLHTACRFSSDRNIRILVEACPETSKISNNSGDLPLHYVIMHGKGMEALRSIVIANPLAVTWPNMYGDTPLGLFYTAWKNGLTAFSREANTSHTSVRSLFNIDIRDLGSRTTKFKLLYDQLLLLLEAAVYNEIKGERTKTYPLHMALRAPCFSPEFFKVLLIIHIDHVLCKDDKNDLVLHLACSNSNVDNDIIRRIIHVHQRSPRIQNNEHRIALHLAIECGKYPIIEQILQLAPEAISTRDRTTHILPFMSAAVEKKHTREEDNIEQLSTIYFLLRKEPSSISWGIPSSFSRKRKHEG